MLPTQAMVTIENLLLPKIRNADFYFSVSMLHQIAFALISLSCKTAVLLWASNLYHGLISTTVFQYNQSSPLLHLKLCVLSHYDTSHLEKGTFWLHYQLHAQLYLGAKGRITLIVWRKGEKPVWTLMPCGVLACFPEYWPQMQIQRYKGAQILFS